RWPARPHRHCQAVQGEERSSRRVVHERCCGLALHTQCVVAGLLAPASDGPVHTEVRPSSTLPTDRLALTDWLRSPGRGPVVREATGSSWRPVCTLLEGPCEVLVGNASHVKAVPGRKTDVRDAEWIADLLRHGLLRASFIPDRPQRELRELTRYRTTLTR